MKAVLLIGGDRRQKTLRKELESDGYTVTVYDGTPGLLEQQYNAVLLPVPVTKDGVTVYESEPSHQYLLSEILTKIPEDTPIFGGAVKNGRITDICLRDDFAYQNAVPTAEGAVELAVRLTEQTLFDSHILITGYGRVGKVLTDRLCAFCPHLTVSARKNGDFSLLAAKGILSCNTYNLSDAIGRFDIVFNTVEAPVFDEEVLQNARKDTLFIELASHNAGFESEAIMKTGIRFIPAPALPAKTAPISAGKILAATIRNCLSELHL